MRCNFALWVRPGSALPLTPPQAQAPLDPKELRRRKLEEWKAAKKEETVREREAEGSRPGSTSPGEQPRNFRTGWPVSMEQPGNFWSLFTLLSGELPSNCYCGEPPEKLGEFH